LACFFDCPGVVLVALPAVLLLGGIAAPSSCVVVTLLVPILVPGLLLVPPTIRLPRPKLLLPKLLVGTMPKLFIGFVIVIIGVVV
jgi:hypothetical protein